MDKEDVVYICSGILATKKNEIMPFSATRMDLETVILRETSQRNIVWYHLYAEPKKNDIIELIYKNVPFSCVQSGSPSNVRTSSYSLWFPFQFSCSVVSDSFQPHGLQHARPPCPSPAPGVYSNLCPLSWWCHPAISSSIVPFSSWL